MTSPKVQPDAPDRERRRAADLRTGDRIIPGDLIGAIRFEEVLFVYPFIDGFGKRMVYVAYLDLDGVLAHYFDPEDSIALAAAAEPDLPTTITGDAPGAAIGRATVPEVGA